jgi:putative oxidoreductase
MKNKIIFLLRVVIAIILLQTLFFKFTAAPESVFIFSALGVEPWARWASGFAELIASILLLIPGSYAIGAILSIGIMVGAIASHIFIIGIEVHNDGGLLFFLANTVFILSLIIVIMEKEYIYKKLKDFKNRYTSLK